MKGDQPLSETLVYLANRLNRSPAAGRHHPFRMSRFRSPGASETQMYALVPTLVRRELERVAKIGAGKAAKSEGSVDRAAIRDQ